MSISLWEAKRERESERLHWDARAPSALERKHRRVVSSFVSMHVWIVAIPSINVARHLAQLGSDDVSSLHFIRHDDVPTHGVAHYHIIKLLH